ncbi:Uncharacterised protein [Raoultella planticola]|uniref:Uncharacterized protein n=2 Tax=Raoultella planticola TaxID=575 RepID=A0A8G2A6T4_RAOPL|nr:Uncharacterised protein [Raoultella planticola]
MFILDEVNQEGQTGFCASAVYAHVFDVILAVFKFERISAVSGNQRPGEVRFLQVEHQRTLTFRFQFFIQRRDLFPGFRRIRYQVFVVNQRQRFNRDRVGDQFAVIAYGVPGKRIEFVLESFVRGDFSQQARLRIATETVMSPEDDVRAVASRRDLREFLFQLIRVFDGNFNAGIFFKLLTHFGETVIAFVAVNPDDQLTFFNFGEGRGGKHHRSQCRQREDASAGFDFHIPVLFGDVLVDTLRWLNGDEFPFLTTPFHPPYVYAPPVVCVICIAEMPVLGSGAHKNGAIFATCITKMALPRHPPQRGAISHPPVSSPIKKAGVEDSPG